eukprot:872644-Pyramimonas_sp.AAC.1
MPCADSISPMCQNNTASTRNALRTLRADHQMLLDIPLVRMYARRDASPLLDRSIRRFQLARLDLPQG